MRIVDPETGKRYVEKRRVRFNESMRQGDAPEGGVRHRFWQPGGYDRNITSIKVLRAWLQSRNPVRRPDVRGKRWQTLILT